MNNTTIDVTKLIAEAQAQIGTTVTVTIDTGKQCDVRLHSGYAVAGRFGVHVIPVERRTTLRRDHYRVVYYLRTDGKRKRVNEAAFMAEVAKG